MSEANAVVEASIATTTPAVPTPAESTGAAVLAAIHARQDAAQATASEGEAKEAAPAPAAEAPEEPKPVERASERFAALARKEAEIVRRQREMKSREVELQKQAEAIKAFESFKQSAKLKPLDALKELGLTYEDVTSYVLNGEKPTPVDEARAVRDELEAFKKQQAEERARAVAAEKDRAARESASLIEQFRGEVRDFVAKNADAYELTALYKQEALVAQVIESHYAQQKGQEKRLLSYAEAAEAVEKHLEDEVRKAQTAKKFAAKAAPAPDPATTPAATETQRKSTTLSNALTASTPAATNRARTEEERVAAAIAAMERAASR